MRPRKTAGWQLSICCNVWLPRTETNITAQPIAVTTQPYL